MILCIFPYCPQFLNVKSRVILLEEEKLVLDFLILVEKKNLFPRQNLCRNLCRKQHKQPTRETTENDKSKQERSIISWQLEPSHYFEDLNATYQPV